MTYFDVRQDLHRHMHNLCHSFNIVIRPKQQIAKLP